MQAPCLSFDIEWCGRFIYYWMFGSVTLVCRCYWHRCPCWMWNYPVGSRSLWATLFCFKKNCKTKWHLHLHVYCQISKQLIRLFILQFLCIVMGDLQTNWTTGRYCNIFLGETPWRWHCISRIPFVG